MAEKKFDPDEFLAKTRPFDPDEFLAKTAPARQGHFVGDRRQPAPEGPATSGDPAYDMFVPIEAQRAASIPFSERAAAAAEFYGPMLPMAADAATFGLGNRAVAYGRSQLDTLKGRERDYAARLAEQNELLNRWREANPERALAAELTGGLGGGAGLARAGITLAKPGVGWISRAVRGGAEGALQGAAQGAGASYGTLEEKLAAASKGFTLGGVLGTGVPLAASGGAGVKSLFDITRGNIPKYPPALLRAVEADRAGVPGAHVGVENLPQLGPDAMLVDAGPSMLRVGAAAKTTPGPGSTALESTLRARERETIPRLERGIEESFGPDVIPRHVERDIKAVLRQEGPEWDAAFERARAVNTENVANWIDAQTVLRRGAAVDELEKVRKALNVKGTQELDPDPRTLHQTRRMIDGMLSKQDIDSNVLHTLKAVRDRITDELHAKVPGMANLDARWAEVASRQKAFERGQELFDTGRNQVVRPQEWREEVADMATPKGGPRATVQGPSAAPLYSRAGTRAELGRVVGTGADDLGILERKFGPHNWATQNLMTQFGVRNVEDFQHLLRTNRTFRESYNKIVHNSKTADTIEAGADIERGYFNLPKYNVGGAIELVGDALARAQAGFGAGLRNRIAEVLSTRGPSLDALRRDLLNASTEQARQDVTRAIIENSIRRGSTATIPRITVRP